MQDTKTRLERADWDRLRLVNDRAKLIRRCEELGEQAELMATELNRLRLEQEKLISERDQLRVQLENANKKIKSFAVSIAAARGKL